MAAGERLRAYWGVVVVGVRRHFGSFRPGEKLRRCVAVAVALTVTAGGAAGFAARPAGAAVSQQASGTPYFAWGDNGSGQIGDGTTTNQTSPEAVALPNGVRPIAVAEGFSFSLAVGSDSLVYAWGSNAGGQLGDGTDNPELTPESITLPGGATAASVAAGTGFSMALGTDGLVYWWGTNSAAGLGGRLPDGQETGQTVPVAIALPGGDKARSIAAFADVAAAIGVDGKLFVWGDDFDDELGNNNIGDQDTPEQITMPGNDPVASVAIGEGFGFAVGTDGKLFSWGEAGYDGNGGNDPELTPSEFSLPGGVAAQQVAAGDDYGLAVGANGQVYAWGDNFEGALGDGTGNSNPDDVLTPEQIALPGGATASAVASNGYYTSFAVGQNGDLYAWGANQDGLIGDGTLNEADSPKAVVMPGGATISAVSAVNVALAISPTGGATPTPPQFVQTSPPAWTASGQQFSYAAAASGTPSPTYALAPGAPDWLSADSATGDVTGLVPTDITSFSFAVTATNSQGTATTPVFTVNVGPSVQIGGQVLDASGIPVANALVQLCASAGCADAATDSGGSYQLNAIVGDTMTLTAYPPGADEATEGPGTLGPLPVPSGGSASENIDLVGIGSLPADTTIPSVDSSGPTTLYWGQSTPITVTGCPGGFGTAEIIGSDSTTGHLTAQVIMLTETSMGSGTYTGTIPAMYPVHGPAEIEPSIDCPSSSAVTPPTGPAAGGTSVFLSGSGFTGATAVTFGSAPATSVSIVNDSIIDASAPAGTGTVNVTVTLANGQQTTIGQYSYQGIASVSPGNGPTAGGTAVTITGTGLDGATQVLFGSTPVDFTQVSGTEITTVSPPGTGTVDVQVSTPYGTTPVTPADQFSYSVSGNSASGNSASGNPASAGIAARPASSEAAASVVTPPAVRVMSARLPAALTAEEVNTIAEFVDHGVSGLLTYKNTTKMLAAAEAAAANFNCQSDQAYLKSLISLAVTPLTDAISSELLATILPGEAAFFSLTPPALLAVMALTIIDVNLAVDQAADAIIDAEYNAILGNCENSGHKPPGLTKKPFNPNVLIDPSGTVVDSNGTPINGATVTLLRSDTATGTFTPVDPSSPGIQPGVNPETTAADGTFHWDVSAGYYEIQAAAPGCTDAADTSEPTATIGPYPVPPPQVGLVIAMNCANEPTPAAPAVQQLSQDSGAAAGGDTVTVTGTDFTPDATVDFGSVPASSVTYLSATALSVVTPPGSGTADVTVHTAGGTSATSAADEFFFGSPPTVTGLSSATGSTVGGGSITISGTGFTAATAVSFGPVPATAMTVVSDTEITATIPQNLPGTVDVTVANPAGTSAASAADQYNYTTAGQAPAITSAASATLTAGTAGSFTVTTSGAPAPALTEAGTLPSGVTFTDNGNGTAVITGTPAAGTDGTYPITITASNGTTPDAAQAFTLTVHEAPAITSQPSATLMSGVGDSVTVTTTGFPVPALTETGSLPTGVTFTDNGDGTATIAVSSAAASVTTFKITASNGVSPAATQSFTLTVVAPKSVQVLLRSSRKSVVSGEPVALTAVTDRALAPGSAIDIIDKTAGKVIRSCATGRRCQATVANGVGTHTYQAVITAPSGSSPLASSASVSVTWVPSTVTLRASRSSVASGRWVLLSAHANENVAGTGYAIDIIDVTTGVVVASCGRGSSCSTWVRHSQGSQTYRAIIGSPAGRNAQASSPTVTVTWTRSTRPNLTAPARF